MRTNKSAGKELMNLRARSPLERVWGQRRHCKHLFLNLGLYSGKPKLPGPVKDTHCVPNCCITSFCVDLVFPKYETEGWRSLDIWKMNTSQGWGLQSSKDSSLRIHSSALFYTMWRLLRGDETRATCLGLEVGTLWPQTIFSSGSTKALHMFEG